MILFWLFLHPQLSSLTILCSVVSKEVVSQSLLIWLGSQILDWVDYWGQPVLLKNVLLLLLLNLLLLVLQLSGQREDDGQIRSFVQLSSLLLLLLSLYMVSTFIGEKEVRVSLSYFSIGLLCFVLTIDCLSFSYSIASYD